MGEYVVLCCRWTDPLNRLFAHSRCRRRVVMLHLQDLPVNSTLASLWTTASTALSPPHSWLSHPASLLPSLLLHCVSCSTSLHPALYPARFIPLPSTSVSDGGSMDPRGTNEVQTHQLFFPESIPASVGLQRWQILSKNNPCGSIPPPALSHLWCCHECVYIDGNTASTQALSGHFLIDWRPH